MGCFCWDKSNQRAKPMWTLRRNASTFRPTCPNGILSSILAVSTLLLTARLGLFCQGQTESRTYFRLLDAPSAWHTCTQSSWWLCPFPKLAHGCRSLVTERSLEATLSAYGSSVRRQLRSSTMQLTGSKQNGRKSPPPSHGGNFFMAPSCKKKKWYAQHNCPDDPARHTRRSVHRKQRCPMHATPWLFACRAIHCSGVPFEDPCQPMSIAAAPLASMLDKLPKLARGAHWIYRAPANSGEKKKKKQRPPRTHPYGYDFCWEPPSKQAGGHAFPHP